MDIPKLEIGGDSITTIVARFEREVIEQASAQTSGVKVRMARVLGISRYSLERRLARHKRVLDVNDG